METNSRRYTVVLFSLNPWKNALPIIRVASPTQTAGFRTLPGNYMGVVSPRLVQAADIIVIQRDFPRLRQDYQEILFGARQAGVPIVFDLDDDLLHLPQDHPDNLSGYYSNAFHPIMQALLEADAVTAATAPLCKQLEAFNQNIYLLRNYLDDQIWSLKKIPPVSEEPRPVSLVYFHTASHTADLMLVEPVLIHLAQKYSSRLQIQIWGSKPPDNLLIHNKIKWNPLNLLHYAEYARFLSNQSCDLTIAPLVDNPFNRAKSGIKYLEFGSRGIPGVYSRLEPYESLIDHGNNGFLATSPEEWELYLTYLIEDAGLRYQTGIAAQETVRANWLLSDHAHEWGTLYTQLINHHKKGQTIRLSTWSGFESRLLNARAKLAPPGTRRGDLIDFPHRTYRILKEEGLYGINKRILSRLCRRREPQGTIPPQIKNLQLTGGNPATLSLPVWDPGERNPGQTPLQTASIILLTHNNLNFTRLCINRIYARTHHPDWRLIVVDNGSSDGTPEYLQTLASQHTNIRLVLNQANLGFAQGNNQGASEASSDILLFLNNDTVVTDGWLERLCGHLHDNRIGMVGPITNSSGNESMIQTSYRNLEEMDAFSRDLADRYAGQAFEIPMLAFFCVAMRRSVFMETGDLDEEYGLGMFEDDDYAHRVHARGLHIICARDVFIHHWGSASFKRLDRRQFYKLFERNRRRFHKKWGHDTQLIRK